MNDYLKNPFLYLLLIFLIISAVNALPAESQEATIVGGTELITPFSIPPLSSESPCELPSVVCFGEDPVQVIRELAIQADLNPEMLLAVSYCESRHNTSVRGKIDPRDRGLWQINSRWNPSVTDECAFSSICSTKWAVNEIKEGRLWKWVCAKKLGYVI